MGGSGWHKSEPNPKAWPSQALELYSVSLLAGSGPLHPHPFFCLFQCLPAYGVHRQRGWLAGWGEASGGILHTLYSPALRPAPLHCTFLAPAFEPPRGPPFASSNESPRLCI